MELALAGDVGREAVSDTPSNLGLLTVNALVAADVIVAPVGADDEGGAQGVAELREQPQLTLAA